MNMGKMSHSVKEFYKGKNIFITGSTGFLGTSLVEKLLRSFPDVNKIYLLMRKNVAQTAEERYAQYFDKKIFQKGKQLNPNFQSNVSLVDGDLSASKDLGLSTSDINQLKNDVNIVFHCGAIVNFNRSMRNTLQINFKGTNDLLNIFKDKNSLNSFVYLSTIYSNCNPYNFESLEKIYLPLANPIEVLRLIENSSDDDMERRSKYLIRKSMNYYTFSKNITEYLVSTWKGKFPIGIFRPGIIVSSLKEPFPYWIQGTLGYEKIIQEIDKGYIFKPSSIMPTTCIPIDMCTSALLIAAYDIFKNRNELRVYNYANGNKNLLMAKQHTDYYVQNIAKWKLITSRVWYNVWLSFYEKINKNAKEVIQKQSYAAYNKIVNSFANENFIMENENIPKVWNDLNDEDKQLLFCDLNNVDWKAFYGNMAKGRINENP